MIPLAQKIEQLKARYANETILPPYEVMLLVESLRGLVEQQETRLTALAEAQIRLDGRLHAVERLAASYNPDARGR